MENPVFSLSFYIPHIPCRITTDSSLHRKLREKAIHYNFTNSKTARSIVRFTTKTNIRYFSSRPDFVGHNFFFLVTFVTGFIECNVRQFQHGSIVAFCFSPVPAVTNSKKFTTKIQARFARLACSVFFIVVFVYNDLNLFS